MTGSKYEEYDLILSTLVGDSWGGDPAGLDDIMSNRTVSEEY